MGCWSFGADVGQFSHFVSIRIHRILGFAELFWDNSENHVIL